MVNAGWWPAAGDAPQYKSDEHAIPDTQWLFMRITAHRPCGYGGGNVIKLVVPQHQVLHSTMERGNSSPPQHQVFHFTVAQGKKIPVIRKYRLAKSLKLCQHASMLSL